MTPNEKESASKPRGWERFIPRWDRGSEAFKDVVLGVVILALGYQGFQMLREGRAFMAFQTEQFKTEEYQASLKVGARLIAFIDKAETEIIPSVKASVNASTATLAAAEKAMAAVGAQVADTRRVIDRVETTLARLDERLNGEEGAMAALTGELNELRETTRTAREQIDRIGAETEGAVAALKARIEDPKLDRTLANLEATSANAAQVSANLVVTTEKTNAVMDRTDKAMANVETMTGHLSEAAGVTKGAIKSGSKLSKVAGVFRIGILAATFLSLLQ